MEHPEIAVAAMHIEAGQRQSALAQAIHSFDRNETPPSSKAIAERFEEFYPLLVVAAPSA